MSSVNLNDLSIEELKKLVKEKNEVVKKLEEKEKEKLILAYKKLQEKEEKLTQVKKVKKVKKDEKDEKVEKDEKDEKVEKVKKDEKVKKQTKIWIRFFSKIFEKI